MSEQLTLPGFDPAPPRPAPPARTRSQRWENKLPHTLFFAVFPPPRDAARIAGWAQAVRRQQRLTGPLLWPQRLHVTLHNLGSYEQGVPPELVDVAKAAARAVAVSQVDVAFDRVLSFAGSGALVLRSSAASTPLTSLVQAVGRALQHAGLRTRPSQTPHMTLMYDDHCVAEYGVAAVHWTAAEFVLVHSLVGKTVHVPLGRWRLAG